jgi:hypothetical protein
MVIDDLDHLGAAFPPDKADAPLIVDPDAVLPSAIAFERLKPVAGRRPEI